MSVLKGLERLWRRGVTRAIAGIMGQSARGERPDWSARPYRVLFLRHDRIGDMILSTGVLRAIAQSHPTIRLEVLASFANAPILRHEPYVQDIIAFDRHAPSRYPSVFRELRGRRYDAVIDCMVTAPSLTTLLLMLASGARYRIGVATRGNDFAYTLPVAPREDARHITDKLSALLSAFGLEPSRLDLRPRVTLTPAESERGERAWCADTNGREDRRLLVNISAGTAERAWPDERWISVIKAVRERAPSTHVMVMGSPTDRKRAGVIAERSGARLVKDGGIRDALSIVASADVVLTADTSIAHACSAFEKPAVVLYAYGKTAEWGLYETEGRAVESRTSTLSGITAEEAADALLARLAALSARPGAPRPR